MLIRHIEDAVPLRLFLACRIVEDICKMAFTTVLTVVHSSHKYTSTTLRNH